MIFFCPIYKYYLSEVHLFTIKLDFTVRIIWAVLEQYFCVLHLLFEHTAKGYFSIYFDRLNSSEYLSLNGTC